MPVAERLSRWWAHRKLRRGQCDWCRTPLADTGSVDPHVRACSTEHAERIWQQENGY